MKVRIAGIFSFIIAVILTGFLLVFALALPKSISLDYVNFIFQLLFVGTVIIFPISAILYIYWTKFGKRDDIELLKLEKENDLLRKQIADID